MTELIKIAADYLKGQPANNVLIAVLIGLFAADRYYTITVEGPARREQAKESHETFRKVLKEHDEAADKNADRLVSALTGVKQEVRKSSEKAASAAEAAAAKIAEKVQNQNCD